MHHEILEACTIRGLKFTKGQIVIEGDFPAEEFAPWVMAGKVSRHDGQHADAQPAPAEPPADQQ